MKRYHLFSWIPSFREVSDGALQHYNGSFETVKEAKKRLEEIVFEDKAQNKFEAQIVESDPDGELSNYARYYIRDFADWYDSDGNVV